MIPPCVICGRPTSVESRRDNHDPRPLCDIGRCCGWCNKSLVIPARQREWTHRAAMVRLVLAQQWAVAIVNVEIANTIDGGHLYGAHPRVFARLPCAVDVVADLMGVE